MWLCACDSEQISGDTPNHTKRSRAPPTPPAHADANERSYPHTPCCAAWCLARTYAAQPSSCRGHPSGTPRDDNARRFLSMARHEGASACDDETLCRFSASSRPPTTLGVISPPSRLLPPQLPPPPPPPVPLTTAQSLTPPPHASQYLPWPYPPSAASLVLSGRWRGPCGSVRGEGEKAS